MAEKREQMSDAALVSLITELESHTDFSGDTETTAEQALAMDFYHSRPMGDEVQDRSKLISSDVYDVVEGLTPLVLKPFVSSDDVVKFTPEGPEDEEAAKQETEYINYVVTQKNNVFETLASWVKTGLLQKNGVVKYWWEKSTRTTIERYEGVADDVYTAMLDDETVSVIAHSAYEDVDEQGMPAIMHDVELRISHEYGDPVYAVVPPEEFVISRDATSVDPKKAKFVQHRTRKTISALREMGYDVPDDISDTSTSDPRDSQLWQTRNSQSDIASMTDNNTSDPAMREVIYRECYLLVDHDGDGIAELRMVCLVGDTILANEETEEIPFCAWTPVIQPFKFTGKCPADEVIDIQRAKTGLIRNTMDNIYTANNNRTYVGPHVNVDDLIDNQLGGIVRVRQGTVNEQIREASLTPIGPVTMPMMEVFDAMKENRTGFTRYNQGTDANSLNKTATGIRIIHEAGNERVGMISRSLAELGLKPLMLGIHGLCRRHDTRKRHVRLSGKWVQVDPRSWKNRYDMSISVGLGNADKQMQMQAAQLLIETQTNLLPTGIVKPENLYESGAKLALAVGEKNPERYFTAPPKPQIDPQTGQPIPPEPPDPMEDPAIKFQVAEHQLKDREVKVKEGELDLKARELALKERESERAGLVETAKLNKEFEEADLDRNGIIDEQEAAMAAKGEKEKDGEAIGQIVAGQQQMLDALAMIAQSMANMEKIMAAQMADAARPKSLRVAKQPDGSFVGIREDAPQEISIN